MYLTGPSIPGGQIKKLHFKSFSKFMPLANHFFSKKMSYDTKDLSLDIFGFFISYYVCGTIIVDLGSLSIPARHFKKWHFPPA